MLKISSHFPSDSILKLSSLKDALHGLAQRSFVNVPIKGVVDGVEEKDLRQKASQNISS